MNMHKNARLTPRGREWMVRLRESGQTPKAISQAVGVCPRTVRKWLTRYRREGLVGLCDRRTRPHRGMGVLLQRRLTRQDPRQLDPEAAY